MEKMYTSSLICFLLIFLVSVLFGSLLMFTKVRALVADADCFPNSSQVPFFNQGITDGNDSIQASTSAERICASGGNDLVRAAAGDDFVEGNDGDDFLYGDKGNDRIYGGNGIDYMRGGTGDDLLFGANGNDELIGDLGNDLLEGGPGLDLLFGDSGDDRISGDEGTDQIWIDYFYDRNPQETPGNDIVYYGPGDGIDIIHDNTVSPSGGKNKIKFTNLYYSQVNFDGYAQNGVDYIIEFDTSNSVTIKNFISTNWEFEFEPEPNQSPSAPQLVSPVNNAIDININSVTLDWSDSVDPDGDTVTYDVFFGTTPSPSNIVTGITNSEYIVTSLSYNQTYYWYVTARDGNGGNSSSNEWTFTTEPEGFACSQVTDVTLSECEALVEIYTATDGANWKTNTGWKSSITDDIADITICDWHGVTCNNNAVTELSLIGNDLDGVLPSEIGQLTGLTKLNLSWNRTISGSIPSEITQLSSLTYISLAKNALNGSLPTNIELLTNLDQLYLHNNPNVGGTIDLDFLEDLYSYNINVTDIDVIDYVPNSPSAFSCSNVIDVTTNECNALVDLYTQTNGTNWTQNRDWKEAISDSDGDVTLCDWHGVKCTNDVITELTLIDNDLDGSIPASISNLFGLEILNLSWNRTIDGTLPTSIEQLSNLYYLALNSNYNLGGVINQSFVDTLNVFSISSTNISVFNDTQP